MKLLLLLLDQELSLSHVSQDIQFLGISMQFKNRIPLFILYIYFCAFRIEFARGMLANKEDWNKLVMAAKMVSDANIQDVLKFVSNWCGLGGKEK